MAEISTRAPAAVVLLLPRNGEPLSGLVFHVGDQTQPQPMLNGPSDDLLQLASRLLQAASEWLVPGTTRQVDFPAPTEHTSHKAGPRRPLKAGPFHVDGPHRLVRWRGPKGWRPIDLTDIERRLLCQLLAAPGQVCSRSDIATGVWGSEAHNLRTVDQCVRRLRRSMLAAGVPDCIKTVRGVGYRLVPAVARPGSTRDIDDVN